MTVKYLDKIDSFGLLDNSENYSKVINRVGHTMLCVKEGLEGKLNKYSSTYTAQLLGRSQLLLYLPLLTCIRSVSTQRFKRGVGSDQ